MSEHLRWEFPRLKCSRLKSYLCKTGDGIMRFRSGKQGFYDAQLPVLQSKNGELQTEKGIKKSAGSDIRTDGLREVPSSGGLLHARAAGYAERGCHGCEYGDDELDDSIPCLFPGFY